MKRASELLKSAGVKLMTRAVLVKKLSGSFATNDKRNMTQELVDERRNEAENKQ